MNYICVYIFAKNYIGMEKKKNISTRGEEWNVHAKSLQSCPTLCDAMNCSRPGSSVRFSRQEYWSRLPFPSPEEWKGKEKKKKREERSQPEIGEKDTSLGKGNPSIYIIQYIYNI